MYRGIYSRRTKNPSEKFYKNIYRITEMFVNSADKFYRLNTNSPTEIIFHRNDLKKYMEAIDFLYDSYIEQTTLPYITQYMSQKYNITNDILTTYYDNLLLYETQQELRNNLQNLKDDLIDSYKPIFI